MPRNRRLVRKWIEPIIAVFLLMSFVRVMAEATTTKPNTEKLTLLLNANLWYMNRWNGYSVCWEVMKDLASEMGIRVVEKEDEFAEDAQMVMHLDTTSG